MKRFISLILALVMVVALAACGSKPAAAPAASEAPAAEAPADENPLAYLNGQLRVGMECAYAPNNWQEASATDTNVPIDNVPGAYAEGYDVQIARIVAENLGLELVVLKLDWDGLIAALNEGQIDAIIAGMMATPERRESINFTEPYKVTEYGMMVLSGSAYEGATSIQDFAGAAVLGQKDTALDTVIDQIEGVNHLAGVASVPDQIARLQQAACDAITVNVENSAGYLASNPDFVLITFEGDAGFELPAPGAAIGIRKTDNDLLAAADAVLATISKDARNEMWATAVDNQPA